MLGNGEAPGGTPRALLLYTARTRYLFNCSEGTQRLATEQCPPRAMANLAAVFCTGQSARHLGGLPGVCLSSQAAGAPGGCLVVTRTNLKHKNSFFFNYYK